MRCPRSGYSCQKYNTVRRCSGCPLWQQAKEQREKNRQSGQKDANDGANTDAYAGASANAKTHSYSGTSANTAAGFGSNSGTSANAAAGFGSNPGAYAGAAAAAHTSANPGLHANDGTVSTGAKKPLTLLPSDILYHYDGTLSGFFCCVYESIYLKELPAAILPEQTAQPALLQVKRIGTEQEKARRVRASIPAKISDGALDLIENVFLSCLEQKELFILRFLLLAYREGPKTLNMLGHPDVAPLLKAEKHLMGEAHLLKGFIRFSDYDGVLASCITPKNFILPYLAGHFCARYSEEEFIIYDKTHKAALLYQNRRRSIVPLEEMPFPQAGETEEHYRALWKKFYHTVAIEARYNPKCRMTHMPKRYWGNMTEMQELL